MPCRTTIAPSRRQPRTTRQRHRGNESTMGDTTGDDEFNGTTHERSPSNSFDVLGIFFLYTTICFVLTNFLSVYRYASFCNDARRTNEAQNTSNDESWDTGYVIYIYGFFTRRRRRPQLVTRGERRWTTCISLLFFFLLWYTFFTPFFVLKFYNSS